MLFSISKTFELDDAPNKSQASKVSLNLLLLVALVFSTKLACEYLMRAHPLVVDDELFDRPKTLNVTSSLDHCLRFCPSQTSRVQDLNVRKS